MGGGNGCLLGGDEDVRGGVVFAFLFCGLEGRGPCSLKCLLGLSLQGGISFDLAAVPPSHQRCISLDLLVLVASSPGRLGWRLGQG